MVFNKKQMVLKIKQTPKKQQVNTKQIDFLKITWN